MEKPITIFIVGTTAVGKTKLSVELCKILGGEVVNCDSKQLYKYANIMTAKASGEEQAGVPHHMLSVLELQEACYNRNKYFQEAWKVVEDIKKRGKIPVIIGGTNYYIETLLYDIGVGDWRENEKMEQSGLEKEELQKKRETNIDEIEKLTKEEKYELLQKVDPLMAQKLHPNDQFRVTSFLARYAETGKQPSAGYKPHTHNLRDPNSVLFWVQNQDKDELNQMMSNRIQRMVNEDGLEEILAVFKYAENNHCHHNMGALQSIGYKQFQQFYGQVSQFLQISEEIKQFPIILQRVKQKMAQIRAKSEPLTGISIRTGKPINLLQRCKQVLTKNTVDYSKRQLTWIKNRLFASEQNIANFFTFNLGEGEGDIHDRFERNVKGKAVEIVKKVMKQGFGSLREDLKHFRLDKHESIGEWKKYYCEQCGMMANGKHEWEEHLKSRKHKGKINKKDWKREMQLEKRREKEKDKGENEDEDEGKGKGEGEGEKGNEGENPNERQDEQQGDKNVKKEADQQKEVNVAFKHIQDIQGKAE